jgi:hypothetical protein
VPRAQEKQHVIPGRAVHVSAILQKLNVKNRAQAVIGMSSMFEVEYAWLHVQKGQT